MIWALVPVKDLRFTKTRLMSLLRADERRKLTLAMLDDVLAALGGVQSRLRCTVIGRDECVRDHATAAGGEFLLESSHVRGLNQALEAGLALASAHGAHGALILPADIPLVTPEAIEEVLSLVSTAPQVAICPSADGEGTNALVMTPPGLLKPRFGRRSYRAHTAAARAAGARLATADLPTVSLDIDEPIDVVRFLQRASAGSTLHLLHELRVSERL